MKRVLGVLADNKGVVALCVTIFFTMLGQGVVAPAMPLFAKEFGVGVLLVASTVGIYGGGRLAMGVPGGLLSQRYGRRIVLIVGTALNAAGSLLVPFSGDFAQLILFRGISGLGAGLFLVGATVYLRDVSTSQNRARYQSLQELSILLGMIIGPAVGGVLAGSMGFKAPFYFQGALAVAATLVALTAVPETRVPVDEDAARTSQSPELGGAPRGLSSLLRNPGIIVVGLFSMMIVANRQGGRFVLMPLFGEEKGFGPEDIGIFISMTHLPQFFAVIAAGYLADRMGRKTTILPSAALVLLGITVFIYADSYTALIVSAVFLGVGEGLGGPPPVAFMADLAPRGMEGVTMGLFRTFGGVGYMVGALFLGGMADVIGFRWSLWMNGLMLAAAAVAFVVVARDPARQAARRGAG